MSDLSPCPGCHVRPFKLYGRTWRPHDHFCPVSPPGGSLPDGDYAMDPALDAGAPSTLSGLEHDIVRVRAMEAVRAPRDARKFGWDVP